MEAKEGRTEQHLSSEKKKKKTLRIQLSETHNIFT
jgi:hypothetical protein